ncbi:redoxin family protein [Paraflavisolibacter sp. H34]|uniref:redoxin family protein n=1 Tax=Huijunlia imazamoxiresistens TaxID=3127457 RepID=UPI00301978AD
MKKTLTSVLAALLFFSFTPSPELPIGADIPKGYIYMKDIGGNDISLYNATQANGLLVIFSANTCPYIKWSEKPLSLACEYALKNEIGVVMVNSNETEHKGNESYGAMIKYAKYNGYRWYYVLDENATIAKAFQAQRTPECFLFNKQGKLVYHGSLNDNPSNPAAVTREHLKIAMDELIGGKDISLKVTKSLGCTIKKLD